MANGPYTLTIKIQGQMATLLPISVENNIPDGETLIPTVFTTHKLDSVRNRLPLPGLNWYLKNLSVVSIAPDASDFCQIFNWKSTSIAAKP